MDAEGRGRFRVEARDRRTGDQTRRAGIFGADPEPVQVVAEPAILPLGDRDRDAERSRRSPGEAGPALQGAGQLMLLPRRIGGRSIGAS